MPDIDKARQILQEMQDDYMRRLAALNKDLHHVDNPVEKDFAEQATQMENEMVLEALDDDAKFLASQIKAALRRIDEGSYGQCTSCGEDISSSRLEAVPFASMCIDCAEKNE